MTGSFHSTRVPYRAKGIKKTDLYALQLSELGGALFGQEDAGDRVKIGGKAVTSQNVQKSILVLRLYWKWMQSIQRVEKNVCDQ